MQPALLREAADLAERGVPCAIAVVVSTHGSVPGKVGATMLVTVDGTARGTVGGAGLEERVKKLCVEALQRGVGGVHSFDLANWKPEGLDSVCGGSVEIAISLVPAAPNVLLLGAGHCSEALARVLAVLGWGHTVVDARAEYALAERFPHARAVVAETPARFVEAHEDASRFSHVYILGHSHHEDGDALIALLARGYPGVIGVIGSKSKMHAFAERAAARGLSIDQVRSPIGLDVGAQTPAEIAVAVAAEIIKDIKRPSPAPGRAPAQAQESRSP